MRRIIPKALLKRRPSHSEATHGLPMEARQPKPRGLALLYWARRLIRHTAARIGKRSPDTPAKTDREYVELTRQAHAQGDWQGVLRHTADYLELTLTDRLPPELAAYRAVAHTGLGRLAEAQADMLEVARDASRCQWVYPKLAAMEDAAGNWEQALAYCEQWIDADPLQQQRYERMWTLLRNRKGLSAIAVRYLDAATRQPTDAAACVKLGGIYGLLGMAREAAEMLGRAQQAGFDAPWLSQRRIDALADAGDIDAAQAEVSRLYCGSAQEQARSAALAALCERTGQFCAALERWGTLKAMAGESLEILHGEARALIALGRTDEALATLARIVAGWPDSPVGYQETANLHLRLKDWPKALANLDLALSKQPDNLSLRLKKGDAHLALEQFAQAKAIFAEADSIASHTPWGLAGLAKATRLAGDLDSSLGYCQTLIARFPGQPTGYTEAEQTYIDLGLFDKANEMFLARPAQTPARAVPERSRPAELPPDLVIPPIVGNNNDYSFIADQARRFCERGEPYRLAVSIIIPVYNRKAVLAKTLAALTHQTYPRELIEVVVADDGSSDGVETVVAKYAKLLDLKYVYQEDRGYRLAAVRNLGMRMARHDYFIVLDCDMLPMPRLVESYMRYFHVSRQAVLIGHRRFVCADHLDDDAILKDIGSISNLPDIRTANAIAGRSADASGPTLDWRLGLYRSNGYLTKHRWAFGAFVGANLAHSREAVERVGGYDEDFRAWGAEDIEMGYRLYNAGYYFIPVMDAVGLHQEPPGGNNDTDREQGRAITRPLLVEKCPTPNHRTYEPGRIYEIPKVSVYIPAYNAERYIKAAVDSALAQTYTDLEVCICDDGSTDRTLAVLEENYRGNPRVRWIGQTRGGIGKASNAAVRMCRGMYIGQLDADDLLMPNAVRLAVDYLDNHDVGCVYSIAQIADANGTPVRPGHSRAYSREALLCGMFIGHFRMFRKRDWARTAGFAEDLENAVDYDMFLKLAEVCDFHHIPEPTYLYRWHGENTSVVKRRTQERNHMIVINRALARLGLSEWEAVADGSENRRAVKLRKREAATERPGCTPGAATSAPLAIAGAALATDDA